MACSGVERAYAPPPSPGISGTMCPTCLSKGRRLHLLNENAHFYNSLLVGLEPNRTNSGLLMLSAEDLVCWECWKQLRNALLFYKKVHRAKNNVNKGAVYSTLMCSTNLGWNYEFEHVEYLQCAVEPVKIELDDCDNPEIELLTKSPNSIITEDDVFKNETVDEQYDAYEMDITYDKTEITVESLVTDTTIIIPEKAEDTNNSKILKSTAHTRYKSRPVSEGELMKFREDCKSQEPYASSKHRCETCIRTFTKQYLLEKHNNEYHSLKAGEHRCDICNLHFNSSNAMETHTMNHYKLFWCLECNYKCQTRHKIDSHYSKNHKKGEYPCKKCSQVLDTFTNYIYHQKVHRKKKSYVCDYCGHHMTTRFSLVVHIRIHTGKQNPLLTCEFCQYQVRGEQNLGYHMRKKHKQSPKPNPEEVYCVECDMYFKTPLGLKTHLTTTMRHAKEILKVSCTHCPSKFPTETILKTHIARYHVPQKCNICGHMLNSVHSLKRHIKVKHGNIEAKRFACHTCNRSFKQKKTLKEHQWSHTGERPYVCNICGDTFRQSAALYTHNKLKHCKQQ